MELVVVPAGVPEDWVAPINWAMARAWYGYIIGFIIAWDMAANWDILVALELEEDLEVPEVEVCDPYRSCCWAVAAACKAAKEARSNPWRLLANWLDTPDELLVDDLLEDLFELFT